MSSFQNSYEVFQSVESKANFVSAFWHRFKTEIIQHLPHSYHDEIYQLSQNLQKALDILIDELRNPVLVLATTGTTSSGKSTLVNFLCGADVLPTAVGEMSAGSVTIEYSEQRCLTIEETPGALWECGRWENITDDQICKKLEQVMITYLDHQKDQAVLAYPRFFLSYPFRFFKEYKKYLPEGVKVKILDLPGLSYVGDETSMEVIRQCREALCLVTYNSQETDPQKVRSLLLQVVEEVKGLGGSPERMLFVFNKIDVFRDDKNWEESERRFIEKTTKNIKDELRIHLGEYTQAIENLKLVKLSTLPALLSLQILSDDYNHSNTACRDADRKFNKLIEESILEDLPRNAEKWSGQDRRRIAQDLWRKSYAQEFQECLNEHIAEHFPKLVIPQAIERFNTSAGNSITQWTVQTTTAILNSSEESYQQECHRISQVKSDLDHFIQVSSNSLRKPFEEISQEIGEYFDKENKDVQHLSKTLTFVVIELQNTEPYRNNDEIQEKLVPLYDWRDSLSRSVGAILEAVTSSLEKGTVTLDHPNFKKVNSYHVKLLEGNIIRLIKLGYSYDIAKHGKTIEAKTELEKENLRQINNEINELSIHLSLIIPQVLEKTSEQEIQRIYEAVNGLFVFYLEFLEEECNEIAGNNLGINFSKSELVQVKKDLKFIQPKFKSDFAIETREYTEEIRSWDYWFWLVPKQVLCSSDNAKIPSIRDILATWELEIKKIDPELLKPFIEWLLEQIDNLKKKVDKTQGEIIKSYRDRLEKARKEVTFDYEQRQGIWQPMQERAKELEWEFSQLVNFEKPQVNNNDK